MTTRDIIARWYREHGVDYEPQDWGRRDELGQSASPQYEPPERAGRPLHEQRINPVEPSLFRILEEEGALSSWWRARSGEEREHVEAMEAFWAPYLAQLPRPKGNVLWQVMNARLPQADIAREAGTSQQAVSKQLRQSMRDLVRLVARDDPAFVEAPDRRLRDYAKEQAAAIRVLNAYWRDLFGKDCV